MTYIIMLLIFTVCLCPTDSVEMVHKRWLVPVIAFAASLVIGTLLVVCVVVLSHKHWYDQGLPPGETGEGQNGEYQNETI